jgi:Transposase IS116/IS110/IS902 family.
VSNLTNIISVGKANVAGIIAEIGQIERFEDHTKLAKYACLGWKVNQSENTP